ncbi:MAG TPA: nucleotide disphospho-sugar-binding domain-containing protein [Pseudoduganella sp.]
MNANILFAWELGEHLGHVSKFLPLALALRERGLRPLFAVRDTHSAEVVLGPHGLPWLQAPVAIGQGGAAGPALNYADILLRCGYASPVRLAGLLRAWQQVFELTQPALTVFDHSPTALLASRGRAMRRVLLSPGFFLPPRQTPFPPILPQAVAPERLLACDTAALAAIQEAQQRTGMAPLASLPELFDADLRLLDTHPELDHFGARPDEEYCGGFYLDDAGAPAQWPETGRPRVFAYLRPGQQGVDRLLSQLRMAACEVLIYAPGLTPAQAARYANSNIRFTQQLVQLRSLAGQCDLAILYASHATICACLAAGVPMLLLPQQPEQAMLARRLAELGAARVYRQEASPLEQVQAALDDRGMREVAQAWRAGHKPWAAPALAGRIAALLET